MGISGSKLDKAFADNYPGDERFFGYDNVRRGLPMRLAPLPAE